MINIFVKIKRLLCRLLGYKNNNVIKHNYTEYQKDIFINIKAGDLVFCEMPLPRNQLDKVPKDHRIRPYLVLCKYDNYFTGLYCSSNYQRYFKNRQSIVLNVEFYNIKHYVNRKTEQLTLEYIDIGKEYRIDINKIKNPLVSLEKNDINRINLAIIANNKRCNKNIHLIDNGEAIVRPKHIYKRAIFNKKKRYKNAVDKRA